MSESIEDIFDQQGIEPESRSERYRRALDLNVVAPAKVAIHDWRAVIGTVLIIGFILMGTVAPRLVDRPSSGDAPVFAPPFQNLNYILGTDIYGQPIGAQLIHSTPPILKMILAGAILSVGVAAVVGLVSGFMRDSLVDSVLMTITDVVISIPGLPLIIVLAAIFQPEDPYIVGILLGIDNWPGLARTVRSQVLSIREESYVDAARIMGLPLTTILRRDILSQLMPYVMVNAAITSRRIIFEAVGLYFLGVLPFTTFNWGVVMNTAYQNGALVRPELFTWFLFPSITVFLFSFGLVMFSQGMDSVFNVRLRARHASTTKREDS